MGRMGLGAVLLVLAATIPLVAAAQPNGAQRVQEQRNGDGSWLRLTETESEAEGQRSIRAAHGVGRYVGGLARALMRQCRTAPRCCCRMMPGAITLERAGLLHHHSELGARYLLCVVAGMLGRRGGIGHGVSYRRCGVCRAWYRHGSGYEWSRRRWVCGVDGRMVGRGGAGRRELGYEARLW